MRRTPGECVGRRGIDLLTERITVESEPDDAAPDALVTRAAECFDKGLTVSRV